MYVLSPKILDDLEREARSIERMYELEEYRAAIALTGVVVEQCFRIIFKRSRHWRLWNHNLSETVRSCIEAGVMESDSPLLRFWEVRNLAVHNLNPVTREEALLYRSFTDYYIYSVGKFVEADQIKTEKLEQLRAREAAKLSPPE